MKRFATNNSADRNLIETAIGHACAALRSGQLVAIPTETVYGLAGDATNASAVTAIYEAKGRPRFNPLICHVSSMAMAEGIGRFDDRARALAKAFWPGALTLVVGKVMPSALCDLTTAGLDTVAIRMPRGIARDLITRFGLPLAAPSANRSGHVTATTADAVIADLGDMVSVVIDAGPCAIGLESAIVGLVDSDAPRLLRPGGVPREAIEDVLGVRLLGPADGGSPSAPGMLRSHYAPRARLRLDVTEILEGDALLTFGQRPVADADRAVARINLSPAGDLAEAARNLFGALRELDATNARTIAVTPVPDIGLGEAINDRLRRAAADR